jgi:hypothetical protein
VQEQALKQNMVTLHNRINELGVAEPVIQQQGLDRIVVQLPGVQDTSKAKDILGRTATLEVRWSTRAARAAPPSWARPRCRSASERYLEREGRAVIVKKQVILTGDNLTDAQPASTSRPSSRKVDLTLDAKGGRILRDVTRENLGKRMAILLFEKGKGEVLTAPVIRGELGRPGPDLRRMSVGKPTTWRCCCAPARWPRRWKSSRNDHRPEPGRREHRQGLPQRRLGLRGDRRLHGRLLHAVRPVLRAGAGGQPAAAGGHPVDAAGHADACPAWRPWRWRWAWPSTPTC